MRPRLAEGGDGGEPPKVLANRGLAFGERQDQGLAEQPPGRRKRPLVVEPGVSADGGTAMARVTPNLQAETSKVFLA